MIQLSQGLVIAIRYWWGEHWGIVAIRNGRWTLISNRGLHGGVTEDPIETFTATRAWRVFAMQSELPSNVIVARARSAIGTPCDFWKWNCQDLVYWSHGLEVRSPQREALVAAVGIIAVGALFSASLIRS